MRAITGSSVHMLSTVLLITVLSVCVHAQNTILVGDLHSIDSTFVWDTTVFATRLPSFALGHQWGAADLDKLNTSLRMNVTADQFGYLDALAHIRQLKHLGHGNGDTNYLVWTSPIANLPDSNAAFIDKWMGMRWEPAENGGFSRTWKPRYADRWVGKQGEDFLLCCLQYCT